MIDDQSQVEQLKAEIAGLRTIVNQLIDRERQVSSMVLPQDIGRDFSGEEIEDIQRRLARLEAGGAGQYKPQVLPDLDGTFENPDAIGTTPEGSETADTDTLDLDNPTADTDGATIKLHSRTVYNDTGDEVLYGYYRTLTFDSAGLLKQISAETPYGIDTPGACP